MIGTSQLEIGLYIGDHLLTPISHRQCVGKAAIRMGREGSTSYAV